MRRFLESSIRNKLIAVILFTTTVALLMACTGYMQSDFQAEVERQGQELATVGHFLTESAAAPLAFSDAVAARDALAVLRSQPSILAGAMYTATGAVLASYQQSSSETIPPLGPVSKPLRAAGSMGVFYPVVFDQERIGSIYLRSVSPSFAEQLRRSGFLALTLLLFALAGAIAVSSAIQRVITQPILHLSETAARVSGDRSYSIRATRSSNDELGELVDRFNEMLAAIQERDGALWDAAEHLEQRVHERTQELEAEVAERQKAQDDLLAAKRAAEESNRAKSRFLANMSHELRTPLNAILGYSEIILEDARDAGRKGEIEDLSRIHGAASHLLELINDILDISKIEAGKIELQWDTLDIRSMAQEVAGTIEPLARKNGNRLVVETQGLNGTMRADSMRFRQSLLNLLSNACRFTENGQVKLTVDREVEDDRRWLVWRVRDSGVGIAQDQQHKLFQAFSQVDASTTRRHGGTGLGLAISQRFCTLMGGRITVESEIGRGSVFSIWLPEQFEPPETTHA
jgi:signal transduction histidine kinase